MTGWAAEDMPALHERGAIVTGTGGIGLEAAKALAGAGAEVTIAGRNAAKGAEALRLIRAAHPQASVTFEMLDLASLASVAAFAERIQAHRKSVDILINNAAVMTPPVRQLSADGFELQFATNYLGHFALTMRLLPMLRLASAPRVVSLSSLAARRGRLDFADLNAESRYSAFGAYAQSKLACLMFALELQRRSDAEGWGIASFCAHPGIARTDLFHSAPGRRSPTSLVRSVLWFLFQPVEQAALPLLFAATAPMATSDRYFGPSGFFETCGTPGQAKIPDMALDQAAAERLWQVSARLAGTG
ncbi:SDR family oxidoreductase [Frigidibacter sp. MR17.14]|uniref:SDR family oxidoreductase n=1 Tax=Frigidibacter sp. MR17.14 TaxID=3126509 RepID=UPI003012E9D1